MRHWSWHGMPHSSAGAGRRGSDPTGALDAGVLVATAMLASFGLVMIYSATAPLAMGHAVPPHLVRHAFAVAVGAACAAIALRVPLALWRRLALPLWAACVALLVATLLVGVEVNGSRRWLDLPGVPFRIQAAEPVKWATLLAVAALLADRDPRALCRGRSLLLLLGLALPPTALLLLQPDLGSAAVLLVLVGLVIFAAGAPLRRLLVPGLAMVVGAAAYVAARPYALARLRGFLDPWATARAEGFQLVQSFVAFGRGGLTGVGLGDGRQKLFYLPEAHTDFILSVVAEELGLLGVLAVLLAFAAFAWAGASLARRARDPFAALLAFGMTALIVVPASLNAAVVMGLVPTTGLTLPFLSLGGNSLIVSALAVGILLRVGRQESRRGRRGLAGMLRGWRRR